MKPIRHDHPLAQLWILDIDGTLMPSHTVDNDGYWQAVNECFGGVPQALDLPLASSDDTLHHAGARQVNCNFREWTASGTTHPARKYEHDASA